MAKEADFDVALRLAHRKIKNDDKKAWKEGLLTKCEKLRTIFDPSDYWHSRLDKALASGDFIAVQEYLAKISVC